MPRHEKQSAVEQQNANKHREQMGVQISPQSNFETDENSEQASHVPEPEHAARLLIECITEGALIVTPQALISYSNPYFCELIGESAASLSGRALTGFLSEKDTLFFRAALASAENRSIQFDTTLWTKGQMLVPVHITAIRLPNSSQRGVIIRDLREHKRAEEIVASERLARSILDQAAEAIVVCDANGQVIRANVEAQVLLGSVAVYQHFNDCFSFESIKGDMEQDAFVFESVLSGKIYRNKEVVLSRPDHSRVPVLINAAPLRNEHDKIIGATVTLTDITEQKSIEAALVQNEMRFRTTLESIGDAVIATDAMGLITFMNPIAEALTDWKAEEATGRPLDEIFVIANEHTQAKVDSPVARVLREGKVAGLANHTVLVSRSGRRLPIDDSGAPVRDGEGKLVGAVLVFRDISERREAEKAQAQLASIVENSDDAIISKSLDGIITQWNRAAERLYGYTANEVIGKHITMLIPPELLHEEVTILNRLRQGQRIDHFETVRIARDGRRIDVSVTISPLKNSAGEIIGASKIARDITERKQAETTQRRRS